MKIKSHVMVILGISWTLSCASVCAADHGAISLSVDESQAVFTALGRFRADGYKEKGYRISIEGSAKGLDVIFTPPLKASGNWVGVEPSGLPEVHYYLSSDGTVVLKKLLGQ